MEPPTSSFGLLERMQQGDRTAFDLLFNKYRRRLSVLIYYKLDPRMRRAVEVDDILQETFLRAYRALETFEYRQAGSFLHWISRIADHVLIDAARYQNRQRRQGGEPVAFRSASNPRGPEPLETRTPSRVFAEQERVAALLSRLDSLPERYREVILLAKIEGLATPEIAARLGISRESTALLLHRAVARFRKLVEATG